MPPLYSASASTNTLYYGDNLAILREYIPDEAVDLVYLDPPFNSSRNYNVLFKDERGVDSESQIAAFEDTWHWGSEAEETYVALVSDAPERVSQMIGALRQIVGNSSPMMAYLVMMAARLVELHRVLKPTGSLYLHCDPTASHYLKVILDTIFDPRNFRNEVVWQRTNVHSDAKRWSPVGDTILYYGRSQAVTWNSQYLPHSSEHIEAKYAAADPDGRHYTLSDMTSPNPRPNMMYEWKGHASPPMGWRYSRETMAKLDADGRIWYPSDKGKRPRLKRYLDTMPGTLIGSVWTDIDPINSQAAERLGYPTQKPLALLERIIAASSNPGDLVLDPFCGCGTAVAAAQKLGRRWVGIDITHLSIALQKYRLEQMFPGIAFAVIGEPQDVGAARQLAQEKDGRYQFQWWALSLIRARPLGGQEGSKTGKKGADSGIDGVITFIDDASGKPKRLLVQVKSGHVNRGDIGQLRGTIEREGAAIGVFITLEDPTAPMRIEATTAGSYRSPGWGRDYPKIQILTIADLLHGAEVKMPPTGSGTFRQAQRVQVAAGEQTGLGLWEHEEHDD